MVCIVQGDTAVCCVSVFVLSLTKVCFAAAVPARTALTVLLPDAVFDTGPDRDGGVLPDTLRSIPAVFGLDIAVCFFCFLCW